ncbi:MULTISPECIES: DUF7527 domain-containing protein [Haloarcula]|uniref:DUF7527 domain-containing protein n=1 Tax=Haloarcula TaxID=2237 RepID=UPI0023EBB490|nr:hypothetical protein [Halomicroarcula sp. XH51]
MTTRTDERVGDWEPVPFAGGYEGLQELAADEFSGAVRAGPTRLFMLNGTVVGVLDGDIEDFEDADGTAREAPHEALPLLAVMQDRADEVRAKYYTEETAIEEVDRTLADGKFTGFVELSENVLSGDYYVVYHQGRSMSVAWVGSAERLLTDDEAFDQANGEVGIYEVKPVDITPVEIPEPEGATEEAENSGAVAVEEAPDSPSEVADDGDDATAADASGGAVADAPPAGGGSDGDAESESREDVSARSSSGPPGSKAAGSSQGASVRSGGEADDPAAEASTDTTEQATSADAAASNTEPTQSRSDPRQQSDTTDSGVERYDPTPKTEPTSERPASSGESPPTPDGEPTDGAVQTGPVSQQRDESLANAERGADTSGDSGGATTAADLETRSIPSVDPERSASSDQSAASASESDPGADAGPRRDRPRAGTAESPQTRRQPTQSSSPATRPTPTNSNESDDGDPSKVESLESELAERENEISRLEAEVESLESTADDLRAERDRLQSDLEEARAEIERLERQLEEAGGAVTDSGTALTPGDAISKTNLFVRYHSKGEATLAKAHDGEVGREAVEENLRLEYHTQFEAEEASVDGEPFEAFLHGTMQYRFVDWLIRHLLYEIANTGHASGMQDLFDAIPRIDRAELNGQVSVTYVENGEEHRSQERFDVVVRDRMGNPLVVANMNDSRSPATEEQMTTLVRDGERVGNASETLAAAFLVTSSFFEPGALETAEEATSSGLFSRDKRDSYVNLSRKDGYHLCLLEARNQEFHLAVPEL